MFCVHAKSGTKLQWIRTSQWTAGFRITKLSRNGNFPFCSCSQVNSRAGCNLFSVDKSFSLSSMEVFKAKVSSTKRLEKNVCVVLQCEFLLMEADKNVGQYRTQWWAHSYTIGLPVHDFVKTKLNT